ncbi:MAG: HAS-barrel domain-containing protein [Leptolyngbyaceae bacterium]|nr:HAS-barrel domain-containing protein [Leptolyngbyaceae bacterium]
MKLPLPLFQTYERSANHIAEVIETSTSEFLAQCLEPDDLSYAKMPPFGSWVRAEDEETGNQIYAVVYHSTTAPIDSVHRARALGLSLQELREQQPQIFAMLRTEFRAALVGFCPPLEQSAQSIQVLSEQFTAFQYLPPRPPQVHQAVYACESQIIVQFSEQLDFLRSLLSIPGAPVDSLIAAVIRTTYQHRKGDRPWLVKAGRMLSLLLKDDYDRLRLILNQIHL